MTMNCDLFHTTYLALLWYSTDWFLFGVWKDNGVMLTCLYGVRYIHLVLIVKYILEDNSLGHIVN